MNSYSLDGGKTWIPHDGEIKVCTRYQYDGDDYALVHSISGVGSLVTLIDPQEDLELSNRYRPHEDVLETLLEDLE